MSTLLPYKKTYLTSTQLCQKLQDQGLQFDNLDVAKKVLERCSYYRFKAYLFPFKNIANKQYRQGSRFEQGHELYQFDAKLRTFLFSVIEKIEIGVRSALDQWITQQEGNPFWYLDSSLFLNNGKQQRTVSTVHQNFSSSKEEYAIHYRNKYYNEYCPFHRGLPPAWVALELMTFGNVLALMQSFSLESIQKLKLNRFTKRILKIDKFMTLCNWMDSIRQVRNVCGHHGRLFNRNLASPKSIKQILDGSIQLVLTKPNENHEQIEQLNRIYAHICAIQKIYTELGHDEKFGYTLVELFEEYPTAKLFLDSMGFPKEWEKEKLLFNQDNNKGCKIANLLSNVKDAICSSK